MKKEQLKDLILQSLEHEHCGVAIYEAAIACAANADLKAEWQSYLDQTEGHVAALEKICAALDINSAERTEGRKVVRFVGESLVKAMAIAKATGDAETAELAAADCVVMAETKDRANWELISRVAVEASGKTAKILQEACDQCEEQEDEHLFHSLGWSRELWLQSLGMAAILPPPGEVIGIRENIVTQPIPMGDATRRH